MNELTQQLLDEKREIEARLGLLAKPDLLEILKRSDRLDEIDRELNKQRSYE